jgi:hypothetical protein
MRFLLLLVSIPILLFVVSFDIYAQQSHTNEIPEVNRQVKEYIKVDEITQKETEKNVYEYESGLVKKITIYKWSDNKGWVPVLKREYTYLSNKNLSSLLCTYWDDKSDKWSDELKCTVYEYNKDETLSMIKRYNVNKDGEILYAQTVEK